jgi:hypothetical protein
MEWIVPLTPVRGADLVAHASGLALPAPQRAARLSELRRRVLDGHYASAWMMEAVAQRLLASGDL